MLDERPDARLDIAGRGVLEHGLKDLARELGLHERRALPRPRRRRSRQAIEESLAVVVPSLGEGFGMVALEAMERARPGDRRVDRRPRGPRPRRRDRPARPPGDADSLAAAMLAARRRSRRARAAMGGRRAARAIERFPEDRCTERTEEVYRYWLGRYWPAGRWNGSVTARPASARIRSLGTLSIASSMTERLIFDFPRVRSVNEIGISVTRNPARTTR